MLRRLCYFARMEENRADLGAGSDALPLRDSTPCRPKGSSLSTIFQYPFLMMDHKNFLKAPSALICTNFEGGALQKNVIFWSKFFKKCLKIKTPFLTCWLFSSFPPSKSTLKSLFTVVIMQ